MSKSTARTPQGTVNELLRTINNPSKSCNEIKFQKIVDEMNQRDPDPEQALSGVKLYVWRTFPRVDHAKTGRKNSNVLMLECVANSEGTAVVTPLPSNLREYLTEQLGGGRYRISLNDKTREQDPDSDKKQTDQLCQTAIKVDHIEHPPILDPREIDEADPETAQWVTRQLSLNALVRNSQGGLSMPSDRTAGTAATGPTATNGDGGLAAVALELTKQRMQGSGEEAHKRSLDMVADTADRLLEKAMKNQPDAGLLIQLATALKGDSGGGMAVMVPLLTTMITEQSKMQMQMFTLILESRRAPAPDANETGGAMAVVEKLLELAGAREKPSGWLDTLKDMLPALLPIFLARGLGGNGGAGGPDIAAALAGLSRNGQPAAENAAPGFDTGAGTIRKPVVTAQTIQDLAGRANVCMTREQDGTDLANAVEVFLSPQHYDAIREIGRDQLIARLLSTSHGPTFQAAGAAFEQFVDEFIEYGNPARPASGTPPGGAPGDPASSTAPLGAV